MELGYVYLMTDKSMEGYYKIGNSIKPKQRESTLQAEKPVISMIAKCKFENSSIACANEQLLHQRYRAERVRGEWFKLSQNQVNEILLFFIENEYEHKGERDTLIKTISSLNDKIRSNNYKNDQLLKSQKSIAEQLDKSNAEIKKLQKDNKVKAIYEDDKTYIIEAYYNLKCKAQFWQLKKFQKWLFIASSILVLYIVSNISLFDPTNILGFCITLFLFLLAILNIAIKEISLNLHRFRNIDTKKVRENLNNIESNIANHFTLSSVSKEEADDFISYLKGVKEELKTWEIKPIGKSVFEKIVTIDV